MKLKCPACVKHLVTAVGMLIVLLLSLEAGLRLRERQSEPQEWNDLKNSPLLTTSSQHYYRMRPLISVEIPHPDTNKPNVLTTNSRGLRGGEIVVPKPRGTLRILVLGDETTLAPETPGEKTCCGHLQQILQKKTQRTVEVINAAVPGFCPLLSYLMVKHSLIGLQPDLIVLNFDMSDVADDHRYRRFAQLGPDGDPLLCKHPAESAEQGPAQRRENYCRLLEWAKRQLGRAGTSGSSHNDADDISSPQGRYAWLKDNPPNWSVYVRQAFEPIESLNRLAVRSGARLLVSAVPKPWQVSAEASNTRRARVAVGVPKSVLYESERPFQLLGEYLDKLGIPYRNPLSTFRRFSSSNSLYLNKAAQLSPTGHELLARELAAAIESKIPGLLVPPNEPASPGSGTPPVFPAAKRRIRNDAHQRRQFELPRERSQNRPLGRNNGSRYD